VSKVPKTLETLCINTIRGLAIDGVQAANSGHPGLPLGAATMAYVLWMKHLKHDPGDPKWFNRDRFVLSAGHGSMLLYALLHLTGYEVTIDDLRSFRQWGSKTPGHPENTLTPGVEMATGPLGQGISTAVGMALAERFLAAKFNREGFPIIDHYTFGICSDGDLMEGVSGEACSLAGHLGLGKLIFLYDDNKITIDGSTDRAFTEDVEARLKAQGWQTLRIEDGNDVESIDAAIRAAKAEGSKPSMILCRTTIGFGSPNKAGTAKVHGAPLGEDEVKLTKKNLGLPENESFYVNSEVEKVFRSAKKAGADANKAWNDLLAEYRKVHPADAEEFAEALAQALPSDLWRGCPTFADKIATRSASGKVINAIAGKVPTLLGGTADLAESNMTEMNGFGLQSKDNPTGRNIAYGVREHAMAAMMNGINLHGGCRAFGGTFLIFSDYCRPAIRLAALMHVPTIFVFTHDSIGLGEDGPTHQPIEHLASLRAIPNLNVMRPADGNETAACWKIALESRETPCVLALSRQALVPLTSDDIENHPAAKGAYILADADSGAPRLTLLATGSEVEVALKAKKLLEQEGIATRVVNMPSVFLFERQSKGYQNHVLPPGVPTVSVEAGSTMGWSKYAGSSVGIDHFGASAPGAKLMQEFGFTAENVAKVARQLFYDQD